jgi:hypothetical protein
MSVRVHLAETPYVPAFEIVKQNDDYNKTHILVYARGLPDVDVPVGDFVLSDDVISKNQAIFAFGSYGASSRCVLWTQAFKCALHYFREHGLPETCVMYTYVHVGQEYFKAFCNYAQDVLKFTHVKEGVIERIHETFMDPDFEIEESMRFLKTTVRKVSRILF